MISGDLQAQWEELHHAVFVQFHELAIFGREDERRRVPKIYKSE